MSEQHPTRSRASLASPPIALISVDGIGHMCALAGRVGISISQLDGTPVVTLAMTHHRDGHGLFTALTADEAIAFAHELIRAAAKL
jgi:hypothetical protein